MDEVASSISWRDGLQRFINHYHTMYNSPFVPTVRTIALCSAHLMMARVQFISEKPENPEVAPNFCMILRKYLEGSIIPIVFTQVENDRILHLDVSTRDELGDKAGYRFTIEMMGRHSNLFFSESRR